MQGRGLFFNSSSSLLTVQTSQHCLTVVLTCKTHPDTNASAMLSALMQAEYTGMHLSPISYR